jgi:hypothetical protein
MALIDNLIAHWKMEEDGTTTRADSHGSYHLPYYTGGPGRVAGKIGSYAVVFDDGANNYYLRTPLAPAEAFHPTTAYTIAAWVKRNDFGTTGTCGYLGEYGTTIGFTFYVYWDSSPGVYRHISTHGRGVGDYVSTEIESASTDWEFVVIRWSGSQLLINVNAGTPATVSCNAIVSWASAGITDIRSGRRTPTDEQVYVDSMSFWHRSLSDAEITQLYNNGNGLDYPFGMAVGSKAHMPLFTRG